MTSNTVEKNTPNNSQSDVTFVRNQEIGEPLPLVSGLLVRETNQEESCAGTS